MANSIPRPDVPGIMHIIRYSYFTGRKPKQPDPLLERVSSEEKPVLAFQKYPATETCGIESQNVRPSDPREENQSKFSLCSPEPSHRLGT